MQIFSEQKITTKQEEEHSHILVGADLLANLHTLPFLQKNQFSHFLLLADKTVYALYGKRILSALKKLKKLITISCIPQGEKSKNFRKAHEFLKPFFESKMSRESCLISLGGGVTTDIGGFFASILLRGIHTVHIPTTLLGQIDASLGGKSGMDFWISDNRMYKNMIGIIRQPSYVISDVDTLFSLPSPEIRNGLGEMVKYWIGWGIPIPIELAQIKNLKKQRATTLAHIITVCQKIKLDIVKKDPMEILGERYKLNLGHTLGHALEGVSGGKLSHGEAVSIGLIGAAKLSYYKGILNQNVYNEIHTTLLALGLPVHSQKLPMKDLLISLSLDKKNGTFVLIRDIGKLETGVTVETSLVKKVFEEIML